MPESVQANMCGVGPVLPACSRLGFSGEVWNPYAAHIQEGLYMLCSMVKFITCGRHGLAFVTRV